MGDNRGTLDESKLQKATKLATIGEAVVESVAERLVGNGYLAQLIAKELAKDDKVVDGLLAGIDIEVLADKMAEQMFNKFNNGYPYALDVLNMIRKDVSAKVSEALYNDLRAA